MTITADDYINRVLDVLPKTMPLRAQIAMELRGHIAERVGAGQSIDDIVRQLGDPVTLAESYLSVEPLRAASFGSRAVAKLLDVVVVAGLTTPLALVPWMLVPREVAFPFSLMILLIGGSISFGIYTVLSEWLTGRTVGKRVQGLRVVQESGAQITLGQAIVRQLPMFLQFYWIDVMFALFTDRAQRAFEMLSKTRVVATDEGRRSEGLR